MKITMIDDTEHNDINLLETDNFNKVEFYNSEGPVERVDISDIKYIENDEKLNLLIESLEEYIYKWKNEKQKLREKDTNAYDEKQLAKLSGMHYLAQWIINSIKGGLDKPHATNICKILREV